MRSPSPSPFRIFGIVAVAIAGFLLLGAIFGGGWGPRHDAGSNVTIVNPGSSGTTVQGQTVQPGSVVVIDGGRRGPGFFPVFPLVFFGLLVFGFIFVRRRFHRGWGGPGFGPGPWNGGSGHGGYGGPPPFAGQEPTGSSQPPAWFDRWHEQAHHHRGSASASTPPTPAGESTGSAPKPEPPAAPAAATTPATTTTTAQAEAGTEQA